MQSAHGLDKTFLVVVSILVFVGLLVYTSASFGLLARSNSSLGDHTSSQIFLGLVGGLLFAYIVYRLPYQYWQKYALHIFVGSVILCLLVFIPGLGVSHGGAKRWIIIAGISFQPAELLKLSMIVLLASWFCVVKNKIEQYRYGLFPLLGIFTLVGVLLLAQPDTGTLLVLFFSGMSVFIIALGKARDIAIICVLLTLLVLGLAISRPYVRDRIKTFFEPSRDPRGSSYQIQQSLIAIGSGGTTGRGFGQSIQKFNYLPEATGDSIFAVLGEEFGFLGSSIVVVLFTILGARGLYLAKGAPDSFSRLLVSGLVILIVVQSFTNISAMLGLIPLTGVPLVFISHGGTALFFSLVEVGLILNISRYYRS